MPYNHLTGDEYALDMNLLKSYVFSYEPQLSFLRNTNSFLAEWYNTIEKQFQHEVNYRYASDSDEDAQLFQKHYTLGGQKILLHFYVKRIKFLAEKHCAVEHMQMSNFISDYATIDYRKTDILQDYDLIKTPIIIVPLPLSPYESLVVDGNHRLSAKISSNKNGVYAYNVKDPMLARVGIRSSFERALYLFLNDINKSFKLYTCDLLPYGVYNSEFMHSL